jgi:thiol-disulfide isomerase/thioredoxin
MKTIVLLIFSILSFCSFAQKKIPVYKIDKLLSRIEKNNDTLYIVNFWATWCKPCVQEIPDFEKINAEYKNQKVKVILVTLDFKEELKKRVVPFIKKNKYTTEVILLDEVDGSFIDKVSKDWSGAIPATLLIKNNKKEFIGRKMNYEELKEKIISSQ